MLLFLRSFNDWFLSFFPLLTARWSGHVAFPGGKRDRGENGLQTAIREAREEVGVDLAKDFAYLGKSRA
jgi:8-oxo-dGTP pyrophosphatase MutT (NUDIX family)